jgi:hypothetical protein
VEGKLHTVRLVEKQPQKTCEEKPLLILYFCTTPWEGENGEDTRMLDLDAVGS